MIYGLGRGVRVGVVLFGEGDEGGGVFFAIVSFFLLLFH